MPYEALATSKKPALIIYLVDVSASMTQVMGERRRIDVVMDAFGYILRQMVFRSTKGLRIAPRYSVALYAYSDEVYDLLDGVKTVDQVAELGVPDLAPRRGSDMARAFAQVEKLLQRELPNIQDCPAPLVCHMTDGEYTGADPEPIVERIKKLSVNDGNVLVENIFISASILREPVTDLRNWSGITMATPLDTQYARKLRAMSSFLPESYRAVMQDIGYPIQPGAVMMLPGDSPALVEMGFVMSAATPVAR